MKAYAVTLAYQIGEAFFVHQSFVVADSSTSAIALVQKESPYPEDYRTNYSVNLVPDWICQWNSSWQVHSNDQAVSIQYPRLPQNAQLELIELLEGWRCVNAVSDVKAFGGLYG